jgi:hypothetical protein
VDVRKRLIVAVPVTALFVGFGAQVSTPVWSQWWLWVGLATVAASVFQEPHYSRPQDAIVNSLGAIASWGSASRGEAGTVWTLYLMLAAGVFAAGAFASVIRPGEAVRLKAISVWVSKGLGRAVVLGPLALCIESLGLAATGVSTYPWLIGGAALLVLGLAPNWQKVLVVLRKDETGGTATAIASIGPRLLLVSFADRSPSVGDSCVFKSSTGELRGTLLALLPHANGPRYKYLLEGSWHELVSRFPADVRTSLSPGGGPLGAASEGSTATTLRFETCAAVEVGDSVQVDSTLYQVTSVSLERTTWDGASTLARSAHARMVGTPKVDRLVIGARLPVPHEPVKAAEGELSMTLPNGFVQLGTVKGTDLPIGIRRDADRRAHLAILGMSGMGKTAVAHRVAEAMAHDSAVVALDLTGEYKEKLGLQPHVDPFDGTGLSVLEPTGEPPKKAREFVEKVMATAVAEYSAGHCVPRVVLLEEAHAFIPEWNFAGKFMQDEVNFTTRCIMQARKYSLAFVIVSQRTAVVSKSALSQCENYICLRTIDDTSLSYMEAVVGPEMREAISGLKRHEALCVGPDFNAEGPVVVTLDSP